MSDSVRPHKRQPTRLPCPWDSPGKNTGVGCHFLLQCRKVKVKSLSRVRLLATPWTAAYQAPPSMGFSRKKYWSGVPLPSLKSSGENRKKMHISEYVRKLLTIWTQNKAFLILINFWNILFMSKRQLFHLKCNLLEIAVLLGSLLLKPEF